MRHKEKESHIQRMRQSEFGQVRGERSVFSEGGPSSNGDWLLRHQRPTAFFLWCLSSQPFLLVEAHVADLHLRHQAYLPQMLASPYHTQFYFKGSPHSACTLTSLALASAALPRYTTSDLPSP